jgi:integrase
MGRTAYVPGRVKADDVRRAKAGSPSAHATNAARVYDNLSRFFAANEKTLIKEEVAVINQLYLEDYGNGKAPSTVKFHADTLREFQMDPRHPTAFKSRLAAYSNYKEVERRAADVFVRPNRTFRDLKAVCERTAVKAAKRELDLEYRSVFALCVATGCRPTHIIGAKGIRVNPDNVAIRWGKRKVRPAGRAYLKYPLVWSGLTLPSDVRQRLTEFGRGAEIKWKFPLPREKVQKRIASWLNAWLRNSKGRDDLTSTSPRVAMVNVLLRLDSPPIPEEHYCDLMDHTKRVARRNYMVGVIEK